jgi:butyryl-CoA dehydrogenase
MRNPLLSDRHVDFLLYECLGVEALCQAPAFAEHDRGTFELYLGSCRKLAREVLFPWYRAFDEAPPRLVEGRVLTHEALPSLWQRMVDVGVLTATRPPEVGGHQLPLAVAGLAHAYLMAANLSAYGYVGLTTGAARLIESFGSDSLRAMYMEHMYSGRWAGTMALTEPQAGSSLADVAMTAAPAGDGSYLLRGSKIFISGADQAVTENVVNLTLARIEGAPAGTRGLSLFAVPRLRMEGERLVPNDVEVSGLIHKIGWRGLPSLALSMGERGDCRGHLVGEANRGLAHMFQMMNEARLMVGMNAAATASAGYHEALAYARERAQGRSGPQHGPPVLIVEHADVRRMLLRQKAIVEGAFALLAATSLFADLAEHAGDEAERERARLLLDLLTPIAKTFPAERGFEANTLAVQVHGGYGYSSEYLVEAWLRDQKLNSIHEGTSGIQALDLLGRKVVAGGGAALKALRDEIHRALDRARQAGVDGAWCSRLEGSVAALAAVTEHLAGLGLAGDPGKMLLHAADFLDLCSTVVLGWMWIVQAAAAREGLARGPSEQDRAFYEGELCAAPYWVATELGRVGHLAALCRGGDDSYGRMHPEWF